MAEIANHDKASRAARKKAFEAEFGDWIAAQNARVDTHGIPGADLLDALATRLTLPLAELDLAIKVPTALCPVITVNGKRLDALAHYAAPLPAKTLRRPVGNVASQASALVAAMNAVLSGI